jgi:serine/threonine protein kinase
VFDSGVSGTGIAFLIMELLRGRSLAAELDDRGPLSLRRAGVIAWRVAHVLAAAHKRGILHRDIKPANVFVHRADGLETVKVVDFGLAGFFGDAVTPGSDKLTMAGAFVGTPNFVAPERVVGGSDDGRSDVFSLGAMFYEMLAGVLPWTAKHQMRMAYGESPRTPPPPLSDYRRNVPPELESLVRRSLAWNASDRPTAAELAADLKRLAPTLDDHPAELVKQAPILEAVLYEEAPTALRPSPAQD